MPYETTCPKGHRLQVSDSHLGQRIQCPACNESFVVPNGGRAAGAASPNLGGKSPAPWASADLARLSRWAGRPLVAVGLLLALLSKGCEEINRHAATRATVLANAAPEQFDEDQQFREQVVQNEIDGLAARDVKPDERRADERKKDELRKQLRELQSTAAKDRRDKQAGDWHELNVAARIARRTYALNSYWHELFFLFAAGVLVLGLLIVSWGAESAERWIGLVMLAAVLYSIFAGGVAWGPLTAG